MVDVQAAHDEVTDFSPTAVRIAAPEVPSPFPGKTAIADCQSPAEPTRTGMDQRLRHPDATFPSTALHRQ